MFWFSLFRALIRFSVPAAVVSFGALAVGLIAQLLTWSIRKLLYS